MPNKCIILVFSTLLNKNYINEDYLKFKLQNFSKKIYLWKFFKYIINKNIQGKKNKYYFKKNRNSIFPDKIKAGLLIHPIL